MDVAPDWTSGPCEWLALLPRSLVGQVTVSQMALAAAFPVNFALLQDAVAFRATPRSKLEAASGPS